jgi:hypothetical protein
MPPQLSESDYRSIFNLGTYKTKNINYTNSSRFTSSGSEVGDTYYQVAANLSGVSTLGSTTYYQDISDSLPTVDIKVADVSGNTSSVMKSTTFSTTVNCTSSFNVESTIANLNTDSVLLGKQQAGITIQIGSYWRLYVDESTDLCVQYFDNTTSTFITKFKFKSLSSA